MEVIEGKAILGQIAFGRLHFLRRLDLDGKVTEFSRRSREEEIQRFYTAQRQAVLQLTAFYDRALQQVGQSVAEIFAIHAMLLEDEDFEELVRNTIRERGTTAEYAVREAGRYFGDAFSAMDSPYMQAREVDFRDISRRVVRLLLEDRRNDPLREGPAILVADQFLPSEVMDLDHGRLLGLIARKGSVDSHTAILLRAYHIPAMAEVYLDPGWDGHLALLDGYDQRMYLDPDGDLLEKLRVRYQAGGNPMLQEEEGKLSAV